MPREQEGPSTARQEEYDDGIIRRGGGSPPFTGLLDTLGLTASVAVGMRKLRSAYAGSCLRVRRASDNVESDIGFSGESLDWAAAISFKGASTIFIDTWYDQSGNVRHLIPASNAQQPELNTSSQSIVFDGSDDQFSLALNLSATNKVSAFNVVSSGAPASFYIYFEHGHGVGNTFNFFVAGSAVATFAAMNAGLNNTDESAGFANSTDRLLTGIIDRSLTGADVVKGRADAVAMSSAAIDNVTGNFANDTLWIGSRTGTLNLVGSMKEFILLPIALNATQRDDGENNINNYYSIY